MAQYGVGVDQVARASGYSPQEVQAELMGQRAAAPRPVEMQGSLVGMPSSGVVDDMMMRGISGGPTSGPPSLPPVQAQATEQPGTAAGVSAAYRAAMEKGGQQTVGDYYANLRKDAEAYLANPNAPTGVDAYNTLIQSGISTSDLRAAGVADAVLNKIFTVQAPIQQSQFTTPAGMTSAYERSPDLAFESQRLTAQGQDGRAILDKQGRDYVANLQQGGIDAAERAQMLEYATERGYSFQDLIGAGVDPNVLFTQRAAAGTGTGTVDDGSEAAAEAERQRLAAIAAAEAERQRLAAIAAAEAERQRLAAAKAAADKAAADAAAAAAEQKRLMDIKIAEEAERVRQAAAKAAADKAAADAAAKTAADKAAADAAAKAAADAAALTGGVTQGDLVTAVTPTGPTAAELQAGIDAANAKAAKDAADAKAAREAADAAERARIAALTGAAVTAVTPSYNAKQLQDIIKAAEGVKAAEGTVTNPVDTRGSAATGSQSGVTTFLNTYEAPKPFVAPAYTAPTVYQQLPTQPDIYAAGQAALDTTFNQSPRTAIPGLPGQFDYSPAAKLRPATGSGFTFTPPSVTTRPRSLLSPREVQAYGGLGPSKSQQFAQNRAAIDRNLRTLQARSPALRDASNYALLRNRIMAQEFGDPQRAFDPKTPEGQQLQAFLATLEAGAPTGQAVKTDATVGTGATDVDQTDGSVIRGSGSSTQAGGYAAAIEPDRITYGGYDILPKAKGGYVKKSEGSARDGLARFQEGGEVSGRRPLSPNDPLYIRQDASVSADELLRRQLEGIDNAPSARTLEPTPDAAVTESRSMLDRLKGAGSAVNRAVYENISKPAVGAAVDMTVGLGDLAQMGARYLGDRVGMDTGEFTPAAPRVREALGVEGYDPYAIGSIATQILPFAAAGRTAVSAPTAARQLETMFPNLGRETGAYAGGETAAATAREVMPGSTAAELLAGVAGGMGGGFGGSALDPPSMSRIDAPTGDEPPPGSAAAMLQGLSTPAAPAPTVIGSSVVYRSPSSEQKSALDEIRNIAQTRAGADTKANIKIEDIANFYQKDHVNKFGRQLDQFNDNDFNSAVDAAVDEVRYQLGLAESGKGWYDADVRKTFEVASKVPGLSDLARSETDRVIMSAIMAPTSIGQKVSGNTRAALAAMLKYKRTGVLPTEPPAAGTITEGIQSAGWGLKQQSVAAGMRVISHLLDKFGPDGFADWWLSPHTLKEMTTLRKEAGLSGAPSGLGGGQNSMHLGAMILGDKTGRFSLNINGYEGTTKDVWFSRSYNRHFGNMFNNVGEVAGGPRNIKERQRMEEFTKKMQEKLEDQGLSEQDIQAILWYYEQNLMTDLGVLSRPESFSQEAEKIYGNLRPTVRAGDEAQIAAQQAGLEGFRGVSATQRAIRAERRLPGRVDPRDPSRATGPYEAGAGQGYDANGLLSLSPRSDSLSRYQAAGLSIPEIRQVPSQEAAAQYNADMVSAMSRHPLGAQVEIKSPEDLAQARLFRTEDGSGFAVKPDGDIVAVFAGKNAQGGSGYSMLQAAVAAGGRKLDAFDTYLPKIYETAGFRPVARLPWNDDYAPPGWNKETFAKYNNGEPDVVFFVHDPEYFGGAKDVPVVNEYDQAVALQDQALAQLFGRAQGFAKGGAVTSSRRMLENLIGKKPEGQRVDATGLLGFANGGEARVGGSAPAVAGRTGRAAQLAAQRAEEPQTESRAMLERLDAATPVERAVFESTGMEPGLDRASILPFAGSREEGNLQLAAPGFVYDAARAFVTPGMAARGQRVSDEDVLNTAMNVMGGGVGASRVAGPRTVPDEVLLGMGVGSRDTPTAADDLAALTERAPTTSSIAARSANVVTALNKRGDPLGINIAVDSRNGTDYADLIVSGAKKFESRETASLKPYVGKRVGIVRTGAGQAEVIGSVKIGQPIEVNEKQFNQLRDQHLVAEDSSFNIKKGQTKFLYPMIDPTSTPPQKVTSKGIVARAIPTGQRAADDLAELTAKAQTETPEFKNWFGNSAITRSLEPNGKPRRLYHITPKNFDAFDVNQPDAAGAMSAKSGPVIFMTDNPEKQPAAHNVGGFEGKFKEGTNVMPLYASIQNPLFIDKKSKAAERSRFNLGSEWPYLFTREDVSKLQDAGYDGVFLTGEYGPNEIVAFRPEQVKSAISNEGTFDPANPVITKAKGGAVTKNNVERMRNDNRKYL
jgi:hypothetical protein